MNATRNQLPEGITAREGHVHVKAGKTDPVYQNFSIMQDVDGIYMDLLR